MIKRIAIIAIAVFFAGSCYAAVAGNTSDTKVPYGSGMTNMKETGFGPLKVGFDADWILEKDLDAQTGTSDAQIKGEWYLCRIGYNIAERFEPYVRLGASNLQASWKQGSTLLKPKCDPSFGIGGGGKILVFEIPEQRVRFSVDGQYLYSDADISKATIDQPNKTVSATEFKVSEWQITGIVSMEFILGSQDDTAAVYSLIPYIGGAYFDSRNRIKFTYGSTEYQLDDAENKTKFSLITGCDITSPQNVSLNVEGRWIGETALSGGATLKF